MDRGCFGPKCSRMLPDLPELQQLIAFYYVNHHQWFLAPQWIVMLCHSHPSLIFYAPVSHMSSSPPYPTVLSASGPLKMYSEVPLFLHTSHDLIIHLYDLSLLGLLKCLTLYMPFISLHCPFYQVFNINLQPIAILVTINDTTNLHIFFKLTIILSTFISKSLMYITSSKDCSTTPYDTKLIMGLHWLYDGYNLSRCFLWLIK